MKAGIKTASGDMFIGDWVDMDLSFVLDDKNYDVVIFDWVDDSELGDTE